VSQNLLASPTTLPISLLLVYQLSVLLHHRCVRRASMQVSMMQCAWILERLCQDASVYYCLSCNCGIVHWSPGEFGPIYFHCEKAGWWKGKSIFLIKHFIQLRMTTFWKDF